MLECSAFRVYVEDMTKVASQHFGEIELNHGSDHNIATEHELAGQRLELDLNITAHDHFDEAAMHKVDYRLRYLPELVDEVREMIAEELEQEGTSPTSTSAFTATPSRTSICRRFSASRTRASSPALSS